MKKKNKNDGIRMFKYFKVAKKMLIIFTIIMLASSLLGIFEPILNAHIITSITSFNISGVIIFAVLLLLLVLLRVILSHLANIAYLKGINKKVFLNIRKDMIHTILEMKTKNFDIHQSGEFIERLRTDPEQVSKILTVVEYSFISMISDIIILIYVFIINHYIGLIYLSSIILITVYEQYAFGKMEELQKEGRRINDKTSTLLNETMRGIRDIKLLNMGTYIKDIVNNNLTSWTSFSADKEVKGRSIYLKVDAIQYMTTFIVLLLGVLYVKNNMLSATNLIIIYMYRKNIYDAILCYSSIKDYLVEYKVASARIFELMDKKKYPRETFGKKEIINPQGKIEVKNLSFAYNDEKILKDISIKIKPKDTIGIVGASGSGKTTLLNLLTKSYDIPNDSIFIDDIDINELSKDSIRNNISVISQNPYLFNLSIKENLQLLGDNITDDEMIDTCKVSQIHDFIMGLPDKYDTIIGEGGVNLSGGQKQRLAIARALLKKSKIILFDEATSALDNITQLELQNAINNISEDYTIIIVAHRLSTIKSCKKIYVMNDGKFVGSGSHEQLLKNNKYYQELYNEN